MPRCTPCIIPYNGKVRQESFWVSGSMAACIVLFTKSSREGHDFAAIILYPMLVPNEMTYLFFLPLLFSNTHRQKTLTPPRSGSSVVLGWRACFHVIARSAATRQSVSCVPPKINVHKKFMPPSRFCRNYPVFYTRTKKEIKIFLLLLSLLYKHTQANGPDHIPGQGRLSFCCHCAGTLQGNMEKLSATRSRAKRLSSS